MRAPNFNFQVSQHNNLTWRDSHNLSIDENQSDQRPQVVLQLKANLDSAKKEEDRSLLAICNVSTQFQATDTNVEALWPQA